MKIKVCFYHKIHKCDDFWGEQVCVTLQMHSILVKLFWSMGLSQCAEMVLILTIHKMTIADMGAFPFGCAVEKFCNAWKCTEMMTKHHVEHVQYNTSQRLHFVCILCMLKHLIEVFLRITMNLWTNTTSVNGKLLHKIILCFLFMHRIFDTRRWKCRFRNAWKQL